MMSSDYETIKRELQLGDTNMRRLFDRYCTECTSCTKKLEWSCKVSPRGVEHNDRFVHISSTRGRNCWSAAAVALVQAALPTSDAEQVEPLIGKLSMVASQLFVGYSGEFAGQSERLKLYFSVQGQGEGLWSELSARVWPRELSVRPPPTSGWLYVLVISSSKPIVLRLDLVYDRIDFRDPTIRRELGSVLQDRELEFVASEARGIVSLRQAEKEMLYAYVEHAEAWAPLRSIAERRADCLPLFRERCGRLTWVGVPRGDIERLDEARLTLYTRIEH